MNKNKILALTLCAAIMLSGCSETIQRPAAENTTVSQAAEQKSVGSLIPDDNVLENAAVDMLNGGVCLTLNADGKYSQIEQDEEDEFNVSFTLMRTENQMSEEYFSILRDSGDYEELSEMTYAEYLEDMKKEIPQETLERFDENMRLKEMPYERVAFFLGADHTDSFYSKEFLVKCLRKAFEMILEDEGARSSLEATVNAEHTAPEQAWCSLIVLNSGGEGSVKVDVTVLTFGEESYTLTEDIPFEGEITDFFESGITLTAENSFGGSLITENPQKNDKEIYERLKALREGSEIKEGANAGNVLLTINIDNTLKSKYTYCSDGSWYYSDITTQNCRFIPDDKTESALIIDELVAHNALDVLSGDDAYTLDLSSARDITADQGSPRLNTDLSGIGEIVTCYIDERSTKQFYYVEYKDELYYSEQGSSRTDAMTDGVPYYQSFDEYEYFGNAEEKYCRHEFYDIYYPAEKFEGTREPAMLAKRISDGYTFAYGSDASVFDNKYRCEIYRNNDNNSIAALVDDNGRIVSAWEYGASGLTVITSVQSIEEKPFDMEEMLKHARTHTKEIADQRELDKKKTAEDWFKEDTAKYGLPDLSGTIEEGAGISGESVVQKYLDIFGNGKPFTIEYRSIGGFRNDYNHLTTDGIDFYDKEVVTSHDNSFDYALTEISVGDHIYMSDDKGGFRRYPKSGEFTNDEVKYHLPDALMPFYRESFVKAYKGTINGEEYDIEEWLLRDQTAKFFCRDGKIIAVRYNVFDRDTVFYITKFADTAELELIKAPENSNTVTD